MCSQIVALAGSLLAVFLLATGNLLALLTPTSAGRIAYLDSDSHIFIANADGSGRYKLTSASDDLFDSLIWSPDGRYLAFIWQESEIRVADTRTGQSRRMMVDNLQEGVLAWSPDGARLAFGAIRDEFDAPAEIWSVNLDGTGLRRVTNHEAQDALVEEIRSVAWSPDGKQLAYTIMEGRDDTYNDIYTIYLINLDGTNRHRLVRGEWPAWTPDGKRLVYYDYRDERDGIFIIDADGRNERRLGEGYLPTLSPDGRWVVFLREDEVAVHFDYREVDGPARGTLFSTELDVTDLMDGELVWSPDSRHLAFWAWGIEEDGESVYLVDFDPARPNLRPFPNATTRGCCPAWGK